MLIANHAVDSKIKTTLASIGNTVNIAPAGFVTGSMANNALTGDQLNKVRHLGHVKDVTALLNDHLQTEGTTSQPQADGGGSVHSEGQSNTALTSLKSPIKLNDKGAASSGGFVISGTGKTPKLPDNFSLPISIVGSSRPTDASTVGATSLKLTNGTAMSGDSSADEAMISKHMAEKNNLKVGDTFTAYGKTLKIVAIFESNIESGDGYIVVSLPTLQRLNGQKDAVTKAVATADSLTNLSSVTAAIKSELGSAADITSNIDQANQALRPLETVKNVSLYSLIGAVGAGAVIILLNMIMIVRERRREIGILKAIGGSNIRIMMQFMVEALTLTLLSAAIGLAFGIVGGGPVTSTLVSNSSNTGAGSTGVPAGMSGGLQTLINPNLASVKNVQAQIGWDILLYGLGVAVLIALIGSALASYVISKVRPAEVLRSE
jgi:putative ABC transport system permease protein